MPEHICETSCTGAWQKLAHASAFVSHVSHVNESHAIGCSGLLQSNPMADALQRMEEILQGHAGCRYDRTAVCTY